MDSKPFSAAVLQWFERFGRHDLPWQKRITPYRVWVSETMLQQTQVVTVIPYFQRFMKRFPTVKALAVAKIDEVLTYWSGLGYYARARNLHRTAKIIHTAHRGRFPKTVEALSELPGIGRSTAGAILSLGMRQYAVILDGNVKRVLSRYHAIDIPIDRPSGINLLWQLAEKHTPKDHSWHYNQAMMDIGAMVCTRTKPQCSICPLKRTCSAYQQSRQVEFPVKKIKTQRPQKAVYLLLLQNTRGDILLERRPPLGVWGGLWSFPECPLEENVVDWCRTKLGFDVVIHEQWRPRLHSFSHFQLEIRPILLQAKTSHPQIMESEPRIWYKENTPLPGGVAAPVAQLLNQLAQLSMT